MNRPQAVAVYARISSDPKGTELGVTRQVKDCRGLADSLGWAVAEEYIDNDVSAYKRGPRPAFQRLLEDIETGQVDGVIVWHIDRLARQPIDLYTFMSAARDAKINGQVRFVTGPSDIKSADGEFVAELMTLVGKFPPGPQNDGGGYGAGPESPDQRSTRTIPETCLHTAHHVC